MPRKSRARKIPFEQPSVLACAWTKRGVRTNTTRYKAPTTQKQPAEALIDQAEKIKAGIRAKVEHPFRVIKRQFGFIKVRYRGLKKNTAQLVTLFALSNLWMVRGKLMGVQG